MAAFLYMLRCSDGRYYVGTTRGTLENRVAEHNAGHFGGFTAGRWPVVLVFHEEFDRITDAIGAERQIKGWNRAKKEALIRRDFGALPQLAKRRPASTEKRPHSSFETAALRPPQDEV
jgi:predicted GIY-YIG superfamily endonuclease